MKNILQYFEETCKKFPDNIAVADESSSVTFDDLKIRSQQTGTMIASGLKKHSVPVAIYIDKSPALVEAMLSVLYSGNFYVVLDTQMPLERVRRIFETLQPAAILTDKSYIDKVESISNFKNSNDDNVEHIGTNFVDTKLAPVSDCQNTANKNKTDAAETSYVKDSNNSNDEHTGTNFTETNLTQVSDCQNTTNKNKTDATKTFYIEDSISTEIDIKLLGRLRSHMTERDPAYILYTSGSTGQPKGTVISHRALIAYGDWFIRAFDINDKTIFGSQTPLYFSMSVSDLYAALRTGATYQIIPKKYFSFPMQLIEYLNTHKVNTIYWVPSALNIVANWDTFAYIKPECLKKVLFAGEVMPVKQLNYWRNALPDVLYANLFGPTETTDICSYYVVNRTFSDEETLPIGVACDNCDLIIVDEEGKEAESGELLARGPFLADGYYRNPEKTAEVFVQNPLNNAYPEIVYRTGDLVYKGEDGLLRYQGRKDFQIKHMGYRIEPGEIEAAIGALPEIHACVCIYLETTDQILLFYQGKIKQEALSTAVSGKLPAYMRPNKFIRIRQMPYNANGKIDRKLLKKNYMEEN